MKRCICFIICFAALLFPLFSSSYEVGDFVSFNLVINKEGTTRLYFSLSDSGKEGENSIKPFVEDNTDFVSGEFYIGYDIYSDVLNLDIDAVQILLTFTASGDPTEASDFMLQDITNPENGLVFNYTVSGTVVSSGTATVGSNKIANVSFDKEQISGKQPLTSTSQDLISPARQVVLKDSGKGESPLHGFHKVSITINPPVRTADNQSIEGFITGQYRGYAVLSVKAK